jgi:mannose/fructose/N-acetylgalactosamine-specific phosphotransferase system component IIC
MVVWYQVALAGLWGGLLAVERKAFLQAMFSRPLVAATGMGLLLGDVDSGLYVGMLFELYHLGSANLGAALPDHDTLAATATAAAAAAMAQAGGGGGTPAIWSSAIILFAWVGVLGRRMDQSLQPYNTRLAQKALVRAEAGDLNRAVRQNLWGMWPHLVLFGLATAACAVIGYRLGPLLEQLPLRLSRGLAWAYPAMTSVAAAIAVRGSHARHAPSWAAGAAALVAGVAVFLAWRRGF